MELDPYTRSKVASPCSRPPLIPHLKAKNKAVCDRVVGENKCEQEGSQSI